MKDEILKLFNAYGEYAIFVSIAINVIIAVLGVVPSVFITAANVLFFGFWPGTFISFIGEAFGAFVAFVLYRFGFKKKLQNNLQKYQSVQKLLQAKGQAAFLAIVSLRLIPFVPSGVITFAAAIGTVEPIVFLLGSSIGKIPALIIEAYAAYEVTNFGWQGKLILFVTGIYLLYLGLKKIGRKKND